jgi:hypothetical protein
LLSTTPGLYSSLKLSHPYIAAERSVVSCGWSLGFIHSAEVKGLKWILSVNDQALHRIQSLLSGTCFWTIWSIKAWNLS